MMGGGIAGMRYRGYAILRTPNGWQVRWTRDMATVIETVPDLETAMANIDLWVEGKPTT